MFNNTKALSIPEGAVAKITSGGKVLWKKIVQGGLPSEYQEVEWIKAGNDVGAYIDLGFAFDTKAKIYLTQLLTDPSVSTYPFGAAENSGKLRCMISCPYNSKAFCYGSNGSAYISSSTTIVSNSDNSMAENSFEMTIEPTKLHIKNATNGASPATQTTQAEYTMSSNLYLFAQNYNGSARYGGDRIIKAFKYYDKNNELICDIVPCYRKSDNEIGIYDLVRKIFLTNVGSGIFTRGLNVVSAYTNQVPLSIDTDGSIYQGIGYYNNYRLSSSGIIKNSGNSTVTGYIPARAGDTIFVGGILWATENHSSNYICAYDKDFNYIGAVYRIGGVYGTQIHETTELLEGNVSKIKLLDTVTNIAYIRVSTIGEHETTATGTPVNQDGKNLIVTINEEITV